MCPTDLQVEGMLSPRGVRGNAPLCVRVTQKYPRYDAYAAHFIVWKPCLPRFCMIVLFDTASLYLLLALLPTGRALP